MPVQIGDTVRIRSRAARHLVLDVNPGAALLAWGADDWCWWPQDELVVIPSEQGDLFAPAGEDIARLEFSRRVARWTGEAGGSVSDTPTKVRNPALNGVGG